MPSPEAPPPLPPDRRREVLDRVYLRGRHLRRRRRLLQVVPSVAGVLVALLLIGPALPGGDNASSVGTFDGGDDTTSTSVDPTTTTTSSSTTIAPPVPSPASGPGAPAQAPLVAPPPPPCTNAQLMIFGIGEPTAVGDTVKAYLTVGNIGDGTCSVERRVGGVCLPKVTVHASFDDGTGPNGSPYNGVLGPVSPSTCPDRDVLGPQLSQPLNLTVEIPFVPEPGGWLHAGRWYVDVDWGGVVIVLGGRHFDCQPEVCPTEPPPDPGTTTTTSSTTSTTSTTTAP